MNLIHIYLSGPKWNLFIHEYKIILSRKLRHRKYSTYCHQLLLLYSFMYFKFCPNHVENKTGSHTRHKACRNFSNYALLFNAGEKYEQKSGLKINIKLKIVDVKKLSSAVCTKTTIFPHAKPIRGNFGWPTKNRRNLHWESKHRTINNLTLC